MKKISLLAAGLMLSFLTNVQACPVLNVGDVKGMLKQKAYDDTTNNIHYLFQEDAIHTFEEDVLDEGTVTIDPLKSNTRMKCTYNVNVEMAGGFPQTKGRFTLIPELKKE